MSPRSTNFDSATVRQVKERFHYEIVPGHDGRAAVRRATSRDSVAAIAYDAGFGDLSTFNSRFRDIFGAPPTKFRASTA